MDHARKIGKPEKPTVWTRRPSLPCSITDKPLIKDDEQTEDRRLANWQKWLKDRKKHSDHYGKRTDRNGEDLLMNTPDNFRRKVEMKELLEIKFGSANKKKLDKYGNDPGFWATPEFLPKQGNPDLPDIAVALTRKQLNLIPEAERIALPDLTRQEKGLLPQIEQSALQKRSEKPKTLKYRISREIELFEAKELEISKLSVKGKRLGQRKSESPRIPLVRITGAESFFHKHEHKSHEVDAVVLKIQDHEIKLDEGESKKGNKEKCSDDFIWSLIFKSSGSRPTERTIRLENHGTIAMTYLWRFGSLYSTLRPQTPRNSPFFFNKNKDLILPGQVTVLRVWFRSRVSCCSAMEFWSLVTNPKLCRSPLVFRFWGCCSPSKNPLKLDDAVVQHDSTSIDRYLDRSICDTKIQGIIHEILDNVQEKRIPYPAYGSLFMEREIFLAKNPSYFYHSTAVQQLRGIFENTTYDDSPPWSLSLDELRGLLVQLKKLEGSNEILAHFSELCRQCLVPSLHNPVGCTERSMVYNLMCSFFNKFEAEREYATTECSGGSQNAVKGMNEIQGDSSRSTSASRTSLGSLMPRKRSKRVGRLLSRSRTSSKTSVISANCKDVLQTSANGRKCFLYKEIFYTRIRTLLMNTIDGLCGAVDTVDSLKSPKK